MARTDANPPMPDFVTDYELQEVDPSYLLGAVKPKQFLHIDQAKCILCEGCVDICPWKCIHMVSVSAITDAVNTEQPGEDPRDHVAFIVDEDICTRCALCVDRCPTGVIVLGKLAPGTSEGDPHDRTNRHGYHHGVRVCSPRRRKSKVRGDRFVANGNGSSSNGSGGVGVKVGQALEKADEKVRGSQAWTAIFRPGSVFRRGYTDSPRNRSYVIMNNVLYHLHPVKVKRHAVKVSYTLCLGGLSFFLFILLT